ncbi:MAG: NAD(P)-binding domain-containing protein [Spirochaetota bacterium]
MKKKLTIGVIGTGHLAGAVIEGMMAAGEEFSVIMSPRSSERSIELDARYPRCRRGRSNQEVLGVCDVAILAIPPKNYRDLAKEVNWPGTLPMLSFLVGVNTESLREAFKCQHIFRVLPFPSASLGESPTMLFPDEEPARTICKTMGEVIPVETEEVFEKFTGVTPLAGFTYYLMESIQRWCGDDIPVEYPAKIIRSTLSLFLEQVKEGKKVSTDQFATPGGLTEHAFRVLDSAGFSDITGQYLDAVKERLGSIGAERDDA